MLQSDLPFDPPKPVMTHLTYRERLFCLLKGNLDFHGQKTDTGIHAWHAFPAKFPPRLPHVFIAELTRSDGHVSAGKPQQEPIFCICRNMLPIL